MTESLHPVCTALCREDSVRRTGVGCNRLKDAVLILSSVCHSKTVLAWEMTHRKDLKFDMPFPTMQGTGATGNPSTMDKVAAHIPG